MKRKNIKWILGAFAAGATAILLDSLLLEKYFFQVRTYDIGNKGSDRKLRLLLLTDLHFRTSLWLYHRKLASTVNQLQPDLILITGDTLDSSGKLRPVNEFFSLLDQHIKKVAIPGNHEYKAEVDLSKLRKIYEAHNCDFLVNESRSYTIRGQRIMVTGLDDFVESKSNLKEAVKNVGKEEHHVLLVHSPLQQEPVKKEVDKINKERGAADQLNIQYILAGHNHGGQIRLPGYVPHLPVKSGGYVNGWYNEREPYLYVSKGFGTSTIPLRFGARSEVTLFNYGL